MDVVDIGVEEIEGYRIGVLAEMESAAIEEIRTQAHELLGMLATILYVHPSATVGTHVKSVELSGNGEQTAGQGKKLGGVLILVQVQAFVGLVVLLGNGLKP